MPLALVALASLFLSTPSARRATPDRQLRQLSSRISIHALREEGDMVWSGNGVTYTISIHALREEGDHAAHWLTKLFSQFLSTPSARRATLAPRWSIP